MVSTHISIIPEFLEKIELMNMDGHFEINKTDITNTDTGNQLLFRGIKSGSGNQTANLKSLQGISTWIIDEAEELVDEDIFDRIDLSVRSNKAPNRVVLILNPATKEHWIYKRFFESKGVEPGFNGIKDNATYIHTSYLDNLSNLPQDYLDQLETIRQRRPDKYKHEILGGWREKAEGVIFTNWKVGDIDQSISHGYGMDFGYSVDPSTLVEVRIDKKAKKIYAKELLYKSKLSTSELVENLRVKSTSNAVIIADSAEPRLIDEIRAKGFNIRPTIKGPSSVRDGIRLLQDYDLVIDGDSSNLIKELNNYVWNDKKSEVPIDAHNHLLDSLRYYCSFYLDNPNYGQYAYEY
jgi:phage terminase large subunit